jgi:hypothetical protein
MRARPAANGGKHPAPAAKQPGRAQVPLSTAMGDDPEWDELEAVAAVG